VKKILFLMVSAALLTGCNESGKNDTPLSEEDKISYALGVNMAESVGRIETDLASTGVKLEVVKQGFVETLEKNSRMEAEEVAAQLQIFQQKVMLAQQMKAQEASEAKIAENAVYLKDNLAQGFTQTESGLQYKVLQEAKEGAAKPSETDTVLVHYTGTFTDGSKFDSSVDRGEPFRFSLAGGVIQGWLEGVRLMSVGSKYQFVIPPELAYGFQPRGGIPAGSILKFDVELLEIVDTSKEEADSVNNEN